MSFFNSLVNPVGYGAIMYNGNSTSISSCYPLFTSQTNLALLPSTSSSGAGTISIAGVDDYWTVMPGYKLEVYNGTWHTGTIILTGDNTNGVVPYNYSTSTKANLASSIKLYFKGALIDEPIRYPDFYSTTVNVTVTGGRQITVSNYGATSTLTYNSQLYRIYEFYAGSLGTFTLSSGSNLNVLCLLIGGGGGGGCFINNTGYTGSGGGGAGTYITTSFTATTGTTFFITVGDGGAAAAVNTSTQGEPGKSTSIISNLARVALIAGGGGSGGGPTAGQLTGKIDTPFGSTGGVSGLGSSVAARPIGTGYAVTSGNDVFNTIQAFVSIGGNSSDTGGGGGGGGAGGAGQNRSGSYSGGAGGLGKTWVVTGGSRFFAGGGGGVNSTYGPGSGVAGAGGSGIGGAFSSTVATANTGSGGSGSYYASSTGKGATGICIIAVPA